MRTLRLLGSTAAAALLAACSQDSVVAPSADRVVAPIHRNSSQSPDDIRTIFGPRVITRKTGAPAAETFTIEGFAPDAVLHIVNGTSDGKHRATAGTVTLDGVEIVGNSEFKNAAAAIDHPITLKNTSKLGVQLAGSPGDQITISIDGKPATSASVDPATTSTVHLLGDQVTLVVPPGASGPITITSEPAPPPSVEAVPGTTIEMGPNGTQFSQPVTLSIAFDPAALPKGARASSLKMYWWNVDHWELLPGNSIDLVHGVVSAQTTHFTEFALLPDQVEFCQSDPTSEQNLQTAISHIPANGTVFVCDGHHTANMVTIDRPMTLAAEHAGMATITQTDTATTGMAILRLTSVPSGTVAIRDLIIESNWIGLLTQGDYDQLSVTGTTFSGHNPLDNSSSGVTIRETSVATAKVVFDNDAFTGSSHGIDQRQPVDIDVFHSNFHDLGTFALVIETANGSQNASPTGTPIIRTGRVQWNTFTNCGTSICIAVEQAGRDTIRYNQISMPSGSVIDGIFMDRGGQSASLIEANVVTDNTLTGHGPASDSTDQTQWGLRFALRSVIGGATPVKDIFDRNTINGAFVALDVRSTGGANASDNHISNVYGVASVDGSGALIAHRNDLTNYHYSIAAGLASLPFAPVGVAASAATLTCNYWGNASGPQNVLPGTTLTSYAPYSAVAIAGVASVSCDPNAIPTTVRACSTPGGSAPTVSTIQTAIASVPNGGTVLVCDGSFVVNNLAIQKPITIRAEGPGMPTIDAGGGLRVFLLSNISGSAQISGLKFTGGTSNQVFVSSNVTGTTTIDHNEFDPNQTNPFGVTPRGSITGLIVSGTGIGTVNVDHNAFVGGDVAFNMFAGGSTVTVTNNTFTGQVNTVGFLGGSSDATYSVTNNSFTDCGTNCLSASRHARIENNQFTANIARPVFNVIAVSTDASTPSIINGNTITGIGSGGARNLSASYPISTAAIQAASGAMATVTNNHVTNAAFAIFAGTGSVTATNNVFTTTLDPFTLNTGSPGSAITANRNDLSDYVAAIAVSSTSNLSALNIRCNWWGQASGPTVVSSLVPSSAYFPFAGTPIANTSVSCDPNAAPPTTVRACPTAGTSSTPTVPTIQQAYSLAPSGGTVLVCDGSFTVGNFSIQKPVTIRAEGPGMPTINPAAGSIVFSINNVPSGPVTISGLKFTGGTSSQISVGSNLFGATISDNEFDVPQSVPYGVSPPGFITGVALNAINTGTVTVNHNVFTGGDFGMTVFNSTGGSINITNNSFTFFSNHSVTITTNSATPPALVIDGNAFENCSAAMCMFIGEPATITHNTFTTHIERPGTAHILVNFPVASPTGVTITANIFTGIGNNPGLRSANATYPLTSGAVMVQNGSALINANTMTNVFSGVLMNAPGAVAQAFDNIIQHTAGPLWFNPNTGNLTANWNDLTDYDLAIGGGLNLVFATTNVHCNWWGSTAGPTSMSLLTPPGMYVPFTLSAVANQPHVGCSP